MQVSARFCGTLQCQAALKVFFSIDNTFIHFVSFLPAHVQPPLPILSPCPHIISDAVPPFEVPSSMGPSLRMRRSPGSVANIRASAACRWPTRDRTARGDGPGEVATNAREGVRNEDHGPSTADESGGGEQILFLVSCMYRAWCGIMDQTSA